MHKTLPRAAVSLAVLAILVISGCEGGPSVSSTDKSEAQADVSGTVTIKGKPATAGEITFDGSNKDRKVGAVKGKIGADGSYSVKAYVGSNSVIVNAPGLGYNNNNCSVTSGDNKFDVKID